MNNDWKSRLLSFVTLYKEDLTSLKINQANVRAQEKNLKGSSTEPSAYTLELNEIKNSMESLIKTFSHQTDPQVKVLVGKDGKPKGLNILGPDGRITSISVVSKETVNYSKMIDQMIIDGIITHEQANNYKAMNIVNSQSITIK